MKTRQAHAGRIALMLMLVAVLAAPLGACGKKGTLEPPEDSEYPREYPAR